MPQKMKTAKEVWDALVVEMMKKTKMVLTNPQLVTLNVLKMMMIESF